MNTPVLAKLEKNHRDKYEESFSFYSINLVAMQNSLTETTTRSFTLKLERITLFEEKTVQIDNSF